MGNLTANIGMGAGIIVLGIVMANFAFYGILLLL